MTATGFSLTGCWLLLLASLTCLAAQSTEPLVLERTIALPGVRGRMDHMFFDAPSERLFVAALENNTLEVVDVKAGRRVHTISGLHGPQGVFYESGANRIYVANGEDGTVRVFNGTSYQAVTTVKLGDDADNVRWDAATKQLYVGYGSGALAAINGEGVKTADIQLGAHPESFQLESHGPKIFVNLPRSRKVAIIDRATNLVVSSWSTDGAFANFPMALDERDHRLFIGCRLPARLVVLDTGSGKPIGKFPIAGDCDDVFYDAATKRIYASGGEGSISVYQQQGADQYRLAATVATRKGARTSLFSPGRESLFVAERNEGASDAAIVIYRVKP